MKTQILLVLAAGSLAVSCASVRDSRVNPFNWFGGGRDRTSVVEVDPAAVVDPRPLMDQIIGLDVARTPSGAIIHATGLPAVQGYHNAELVALNRGRAVDGVLRFEFRVAPPLAARPSSTQQSRTIEASAVVPDARLIGVTRVEVIGAQNTRVVNRR